MEDFRNMDFWDLSSAFEEMMESVSNEVDEILAEAEPLMDAMAQVCIMLDAPNQKLLCYEGTEVEGKAFFEHSMDDNVKNLAEIMKYLPAVHRAYLEESLPQQEDMLDFDAEDPAHEIPRIIEEELEKYNYITDELVFTHLDDDTEIEFYANTDTIYNPEA